MNKQQGKALLIGIVVLVASWMFRFVIGTAMQMYFTSQHAMHSAQQAFTPKPKAVTQVPASRTPAQVKAVPQSTPPAVLSASGGFANLPGVWYATTAIEGRGLCTIRIEIQPEGERFKGFTSFTCVEVNQLVAKEHRTQPELAAARTNPVIAFMTGEPKDGEVRFKVDKTMGKDILGCAITSMVLTPYGTQNIYAAEWESGSCPGGHALLMKGKR